METLAGVNLTVSDIKFIDLRNEAIKNLGACFSWNNTIKEECRLLKFVSNMQTLRKIPLFHLITAMKILWKSTVLLEILRKLCFLAIFPNREITWYYGILRSESLLKVWQCWQLTLEERIVVFKEFSNLKNSFSFSDSTHKTLCKNYKKRGLNNLT